MTKEGGGDGEAGPSTRFSSSLWTNKKKVKNSAIKKKLFQKKKKGARESESDEVTRILSQRKTIDSSKIAAFKDFPLSRKTLDGLEESEYSIPTDIQKEAIALALRGLDILGAAKTGSGKTLAFVIPILELLYTKLWTNQDGLGALIITPTRELAYQIFQTLRNVGRNHDFSAALVIGGKDLKFERKRMDQVNIVICTPGRILQHMDENAAFDCSNLQILVLDEADRCLDMGFETAMNAIVANLPIERQTLLFSATQTKSVKDLARLSLKSPVYVSVHENSQFCTPETLQQSYMVCPLESKLDMLWSFLKHHKRSKILVFLSSCKQVRFVHMLFCRMRPGISLLALYGSLHQLKRMSVYDDFCKKEAVVLIATDIAARGLDFPEVDWVIQLDCPEDATTYIHRVGRTARYNKDGEALLVLLPSEEKGALEELEKKKVPIARIEANPKKMMSVQRKFEALLARDTTLKDCAQRAFKSYLKFVFTMKNKKVFDVKQLDLVTFARSLGLAVAPRVRFLQKRMGEQYKALGSSLANDADKDEDEEDEDHHDQDVPESDSEISNKLKQPISIRPSRRPQTFDFSIEGEGDDNDELDDLFVSKKPSTLDFGDDDEDDVEGILEADRPNVKSRKGKTKAKLAKKLLKKNIFVNKKVNFDEEGDTVKDVQKEKQSALAKNYEKEEGVSGIDIERAKEILKLEDQFDKQMFRERIRQKHREERLKAKLLRKGSKKQNDEDEVEAKIGNEDYEKSDDDDYEPNLDWLPDPDKVYGDDKEQKEESESDNQEEEEIPVPLEKTSKRKVSQSSSDKVQKKKQKVSKSLLNDDDLDGDLMEELALKLLSNR